MLFWVCTFRNFENWNKSAHWCKARTFFFGFNSHKFPLFTITVRRQKPQGTSSLIHFFIKPSIVKQLFMETGAWLFHIYVIPCIRSFRCLISHTLWPVIIFFEGYPSISPFPLKLGPYRRLIYLLRLNSLMRCRRSTIGLYGGQSLYNFYAFGTGPQTTLSRY